MFRLLTVAHSPVAHRTVAHWVVSHSWVAHSPVTHRAVSHRFINNPASIESALRLVIHRNMQEKGPRIRLEKVKGMKPGNCLTVILNDDPIEKRWFSL